MDLGEAFRRAGDRLHATVAALDGDDWEKPTVCEIAVRELVVHIIAGNYFATHLLAGATGHVATEAAAQHVGTINDLVVEVAPSCEAQTEAFLGVDRGRTLHHPAGDIDFDTFVRYRLGDLVVHWWDIASALRGDTTIDNELATELWRRVEPHIEEMRDMGSYGQGAAGTVPAHATVQQRLLDAFGRGRLAP